MAKYPAFLPTLHTLLEPAHMTFDPNLKDDSGATLLERVLSETRAAVVITNAEMARPGPQIVAASPGFCRLTGFSLEELLGNTPRMLQGPLTDRAVLERLVDLCNRGEPFSGETVNYRKDGTAYIVEWCINPVRDASGQITHFASVQHDVTAQRKFAQAWLESEAKAKKALAAATLQMAAITEAILVLEKTKRSFRSAELGGLRRRLAELQTGLMDAGLQHSE